MMAVLSGKIREDVSQLTSFADLRERLLPHLVTKG